jgi:hypothetical protein
LIVKPVAARHPRTTILNLRGDSLAEFQGLPDVPGDGRSEQPFVEMGLDSLDPGDVVVAPSTRRSTTRTAVVQRGRQIMRKYRPMPASTWRERSRRRRTRAGRAQGDQHAYDVGVAHDGGYESHPRAGRLVVRRPEA